MAASATVSPSTSASPQRLSAAQARRVAIAAQGDGHVDILAELAEILMDEDRAKALREATDPDEVMSLLKGA